MFCAENFAQRKFELVLVLVFFLRVYEYLSFDVVVVVFLLVHVHAGRRRCGLSNRRRRDVDNSVFQYFCVFFYLLFFRLSIAEAEVDSFLRRSVHSFRASGRRDFIILSVHCQRIRDPNGFSIGVHVDVFDVGVGGVGVFLARIN